MKKTIFFTLVVLMTLSFLVGCQKKVKLCTMTTPSLSENQWNMYYPYHKNQQVSFYNEDNDTLTFLVENTSAIFDSCTTTYPCGFPVDCVCRSFVVLKSLDDEQYIKISTSNGTSFGISFSFPRLWIESYSFSYNGCIYSLEYALGDTIPYLFVGEGNACHIKDVVHVKEKGLISFYDISRHCTWHLME